MPASNPDWYELPGYPCHYTMTATAWRKLVEAKDYDAIGRKLAREAIAVRTRNNPTEKPAHSLKRKAAI